LAARVGLLCAKSGRQSNQVEQQPNHAIARVIPFSPLPLIAVCSGFCQKNAVVLHSAVLNIKCSCWLLADHSLMPSNMRLLSVNFEVDLA